MGPHQDNDSTPEPTASSQPTAVLAKFQESSVMSPRAAIRAPRGLPHLRLFPQVHVSGSVDPFAPLSAFNCVYCTLKTCFGRFASARHQPSAFGGRLTGAAATHTSTNTVHWTVVYFVFSIEAQAPVETSRVDGVLQTYRHTDIQAGRRMEPLRCLFFSFSLRIFWVFSFQTAQQHHGTHRTGGSSSAAIHVHCSYYRSECVSE